MCDLYSMTKNVDAIRRLFKVDDGALGNAVVDGLIFRGGK